MKTMKYFLSMAALALVGAMTVSCSSDNDITAQPQQPENQSKLVTLTATIGLDGGTTRALTATGVKTFADGETMAVIYKKNSGDYVKAVSNPLDGSGDIDDSGKSASFTFTLDDPDKSEDVTYIYPAAMAGETGVDYTKLNSQTGGTLADLGSKYDLCTKSAEWDGDNLPSPTLDNQLAILAVTLKNSGGSSEITGSVTRLMVNDGTYTYYVDRSAAAGPIYVAIRPTANATINITAKTSTGYHVKTLTGKTYAKNNGYNVSWRMTELPEGALHGQFSVSANKKVYFSKGNLQATYNGSTWTWAFAANQWDYIGNAEGNTKVTDASPYVSGYSGSSTTVDLFGWVGASSKFTGVAQYGITSSFTLNSEDGYGNGIDEILKSDWGATMGSGWCTLSNDEWSYLFNNRSDAADKYGFATISTTAGDVHGIIILPDAFVDPRGNMNEDTDDFVGSTIDWNANLYTAENWALMEKNGAVFLPAAGYRDEAVVEVAGDRGYYWSSSAYGDEDADYARYVYFSSDDQSSELIVDDYTSRYCGHSVRLVRPVQ